MNFVEKLAYFGILAAVFAVINLNAQKLFPTKATESQRRAHRLLAFAISLLLLVGGVDAGFSIFR